MVVWSFEGVAIESVKIQCQGQTQVRPLLGREIRVYSPPIQQVSESGVLGFSLMKVLETLNTKTRNPKTK